MSFEFSTLSLVILLLTLLVCPEIVSEIENVSMKESNLTSFFGGGFQRWHMEHMLLLMLIPSRNVF